MKNTIYHPPRKIPVLGQYDVVVCGGGPAGCAAAIAAARHGAKTLLLEKYGFLGGATVAQLVSVVLSTNAVDFQGIWHEWAARLLRRRAMAPWVRSASHFYPESLPAGRYLVDTAAELGIRTSRIVQGVDRVTDEDAWNLRKTADGIARSSWEIDIHPPDDERPLSERWFHSKSAAYAAFAKRLAAGDWFDIPYGCLVAAGIDNLLVAGRCISAGYLAQGSLRIQQTCMATGQAAGVAAALSIQADKTPRELEPAAVVKQLEADRDVETALDMSR